VYGVAKKSITFTGKDKTEVKRRALDYWYRKSRPSGRSLVDFLGRCRLSGDGRVIVFLPWK